jgi:hypothetical protein
VTQSIPDFNDFFGKQQETLRDVAVEMRSGFLESLLYMCVYSFTHLCIQERMGSRDVEHVETDSVERDANCQPS